MIWPLKRTGRRDTQTGVVLDEKGGGAAAVIQRRGSRIKLLHSACCVAPSDGAWPLSELLGSYNDSVIAVLPPNHYQLLMVERPDVPEAELASAVRWRVKDLINTPVEEAVVDVFDVPAQARGKRDMIYAVAAAESSVKELATCLSDNDAQLHAVDIAELCLRNIATILPEDRFGVACLLVDGQRGILTLTRDQQLYLVRQLDIPIATGLNEEIVSAVALELQRSLDFFESHYDQRPIRDVVLAPSPDAVALAEALGREMAVNVSQMDLNTFIESPHELSADEQSACLLALGAALRGPDQLEQAA